MSPSVPLRSPILLASDLDRTILPNGPAEESAEARPLLRELACRAELTIFYVSGRHRRIIETAIGDYGLPTPRCVIGDVGTTVYRVEGDEWSIDEDWHREIGRDWNGKMARDLEPLLVDLPELELQEPEKQGRYKLSFYVPGDADGADLRERTRRKLADQGVAASVIWSIDDETGVGLLDVLPARASKLHALRFVMERDGYGEERTVFAGDSGNDLAVLTSGLKAVLVRNAREDVREEARRTLAAKGVENQLYLPRGEFLGMNGNYTAGVLEGLAHFFPEIGPHLEEIARELRQRNLSGSQETGGDG